MKNDLPYFSHDNNARNHPKMKALRAKFGPDGYGRFWMLNEMISQAAEARLDLSKRINRLAAAEELGFNEVEFTEFLTFLCDPEIDLVNEESGILTTDRTRENYSFIEAERLRKRGQGKNSAEKGQSSAEKGDSSAEESNKAKQSKVNKEELASRPAAVDNFLAKATERDLAALLAYAVETMKKRPRISDPLKAAKKHFQDPDLVEAFLASRPAPPTFIAPEPGPCPECGGHRKADCLNGEARCVDCGVEFKFDRAWGEWMPDAGPQPPVDDFSDTG